MSQRGSSTIIILLVAIIVVLLGAAGVGAYIILTSQRPTAGPVPVQLPTGPPRPIPSPVQPYQPPQPPAAPAASDLISKLELTATSPTDVAPGESVKFKMSYVFGGSEKTKLEAQLAWRMGDGQLTYGKVFEDEVAPGAFSSDGWAFRSAPDAAPGTKFAMFAVVRSAGKIFISQTPVVMTIRGSAAPAQPPVQPVASDLIGDLKIIAVSPTEVPPGEAVKFKMTYVFNGTEKTKVPAQLAWKVGEGELTYGKPFDDDVVPGPNTSEGWSFKFGADPVGTRFTMFAVIKAGGKSFISQAGVPVTVAVSAQPAPQPQPAPAPQPAPQPVPAPPPAPQPAPAPAPIPPVPAPPKPAPVAPVLDWQTYRDPGARFTMDYPVGWRTQLIEGGYISFYKDHPEEGIAFIHNPWASLRGVHTGRSVAQLFVEHGRRKYPDLQVTGQNINTIGKTSGMLVEAAILEVVWTNLRGERMRGRIAIVAGSIQTPGVPSETTLHYWAYQSPEIAWDAMQSTFIQMYQSWNGRAYVSSPP